MSGQRPSRRKTHVPTERPPFERIALILQGGGALGSYQAVVYQAPAEANLQPDWVAGVSIGAVNSALIAGNPPERRVDRLREFWEGVTSKDYEFSRGTMEEHWRSGYNDAVRTFRHAEVLQRPNGPDGVFTFDLSRDGRE